MANKKEYFSIRQVIELTGVSEFTLRGWENRYKAFSPRRTTTGRRQYSASDIQKARLLDELTKINLRIGDIAHLDISELEKLRAEKSSFSVTTADLTVPKKSDAKKIIELAHIFDWDQISKLLQKKSAKTSATAYVLEHIAPLVSEMNSLIGSQQFSIAQEHILSALIKEQLTAVKLKTRKAQSQSRVVLTTPEGDLHDMGLFMSSAVFCDHGIKNLFLGPSTPKKDLSETALRFGATHILIASTISEQEGAKESLYNYINFLDRNLPAGISFILAGRNTRNFSAKLKRPIHLLTSLQDLAQLVEHIS